MSAPVSLSAGLDTWLDAHVEELVAFRRHLHAHPELSFEEHRTTDYLEERLRVAGLEPSRLSSGTGLVCDVAHDGLAEGGARTVALRGDIDALAMDDETDTLYRSQVPGVAHACGHDVHTTVVLGAGLFLHTWLQDGSHAGRVRLLFQPGEERVPGGALIAIADGVLRDVDAVFGLHCDPKLEVGHLGVRAGPITSASDMFELRISGPGGHTARPEATVDLVRVLARLAIEVPEGARRATAADHPLNVVFGAAQAGNAGNVIPAHGVLRGTVRTTDRGVWDEAPHLIEAIVDELVAPTGATVEVDYTRGIPPVVNDPGATEVLAAAAREVLGADAVVPTIQSAGGDDFAWLLEHVPGSYARLGVHDPGSGEPVLDLHAGHFDVDERAIAVGVRVLASTALRRARRVDSRPCRTSSKSPGPSPTPRS